MSGEPPGVLPRIALLSLEPWDDTWRRNQHLASALVAGSMVDRMTFVEPAEKKSSRTSREPLPGITVYTPVSTLPGRLGRARAVARQVRRDVLPDVDLLWVNDPVVGAYSLDGMPALYDVTDDWRLVAAAPHVRRRIVRSEDRLAQRARTVVCSSVLQERWRQRYGVTAELVHNGVDVERHRQAQARPLDGVAPHVGYVGTLHRERLDVDLLLSLAADPRIGTLHLVGPDCLDVTSRERIAAGGIVLHGPVPATEVPTWMASLDVLVCPHLITPFTLSLDAIKAYEYAASGRPVVATPTSGFQHLAGQVRLATGDDFADQVVNAWGSPPAGQTAPPTWEDRAAEMARVIREVLA